MANNSGIEMQMFSCLDTTSKDISFIKNADLRLIQTEQDLQDALDWISLHDLIAFDIETTGLSHIYDSIVGVSFGTGDTAFYLPIGHKLDDNCPYEYLISILKALSVKSLIYHNGKFDWKFIYYKTKIDLPITHDTLAIAALWDSDRIEKKTALSLKHLTKELLNIDMLELEEDLNTTDFSVVPLSDAIYYAATDSLCTFKLFEYLYHFIKDLNLEYVYSLELSIIKSIGTIELNGIKIDLDFIRNNVPKLEKLCFELKEEIEAYGDNEYDVNSPQQLSQLLYERLKIKQIKNSTSTDVRILEKLENEHEIIPKLITYSALDKLRNSFFGKIESTIAEDGRVHSDFNQFGARSGRFSSSGGVGKNGMKISINMQQMPKEHEGFNIRKAFITEPGYYWLHCDYSQLEYRTMASLSGEDSLIDAFIHGVDFHVKTAATFLNIPIEKVGKEERAQGKTLNFAVSYGMSKYGLANRLGKSPKEAGEMLEAYFRNLPKLTRLSNRIKEDAHRNGFVKTYFGRIRWFRNMPTEQIELENYLRRTFNTYIQGTAADIAKMGIQRTFEALAKSKYDIRCVSTIHDELNFEVNKNIPVVEAAKFIRDAMSIQFPTSKGIRWAPFRADVSIGPSFGEQYEMEDYYTEEYEGLLYDDFIAKIGGSSKEQTTKLSQIFLEKPCVLLQGNLSNKKAENLKTLISKNPGEYRIYFKEGLKVYRFDDSIKINPTPLVLNELYNLGFEASTYVDKTDLKLDLNKILGDI